MRVNVQRMFALSILLIASSYLGLVLNGMVQVGGPRFIESVEIVGYRRLTEREVRSHIRMRSGQLFTFERSQRDLKALLATGLFDAGQTRVFGETGVRGGVVVIFEVVEMPLISNVTFKGLSRIQVTNIVTILRTKGVDLGKDSVYQPDKVQTAQRLIKEFLASQGWHDVAVTNVRQRNDDATISIEFEISRSR